MSGPREGVIRINWVDERKCWCYEHVRLDNGEHAGNLDILVRYSDGTYENLINVDKLWISDDIARGIDLKVTGYCVRLHSNEPFVWMAQ